MNRHFFSSESLWFGTGSWQVYTYLYDIILVCGKKNYFGGMILVNFGEAMLLREGGGHSSMEFMGKLVNLITVNEIYVIKIR